MVLHPTRVPRRWLAALLCGVALLTACGGGGGGGPAGSADCTVAGQNQWLRGYMRDWYFWAGAAPDPDPAPFASVADYFGALLFTGDASVPADRWSYITDTAAFDLFYGEGRTLGYGLSVNGLEGQLPLRVRLVDPGSPAAAAGLRRGDRIVSIDGRSAAELLASQDFAVLTPAKAGVRLDVVIDRGAGLVTLALEATVYELTPVPVARVLRLADGRKAGYLLFKDFITQAEPALDAAFADFRAAGATELILDLRYNGGGRISVASRLASLVAGAAKTGAVFAELRYNAAHQSRNQTYHFADGPGPAFTRAVVIAGRRTCSASELFVNGLAPHLPVTLIGEASCGKPFGFDPVDSCGSTFNVVNFESVNSRGEGRFYDGLGATCAARDSFTGTLGDPAEPLTASAIDWLDSGTCAASAAQRARPLAAPRRGRGAGVEPGSFEAMIAD
jgi:hypothetical protein